MKNTTLFVAIVWFSIATQAKAIRYYHEGDTLYVWAQSGLILRDEPGFDSKKIEALSFGTMVVTKRRKEMDTLIVSVAAIPPCTYEGQNYPGYKISGQWVEITANGKKGYVFDGYLSKYPPANAKEMSDSDLDSYLARVFGLASQVKDRGRDQYVTKFACNFYKNGASGQSRAIGSSVAEATYILPELSLEEGYLIASRFYHLEKYTNKIPGHGQESDFFLQASAPHLLDFIAYNTSMPLYVRVGCVNGVVVITTHSTC